MATWRWERCVGNGGSKAMGGQGGSRRGLGTVRAVRLMLRAHAVLFFFPNYPNRLKLENWCLTVLFFPNICMWLDWDIVNNFLNDANIQVPT
jgi:hypothetical protein